MTESNERPVSAAFSTLSPFRNAFFALWENVIYANSSGFRAHEGRIRSLAFLHHAQWVSVSGKRRGGGKRSRPALLFMSYFTGDWLDYLRGFTSTLHKEMDLLWGPCEEWPKAARYRATVEFIGKYQRGTSVYYNGRGRLTVQAARVALETRRKLDKLRAELEGGMSEAAFRDAYLDVACTAVERDTEVTP